MTHNTVEKLAIIVIVILVTCFLSMMFYYLEAEEEANRTGEKPVLHSTTNSRPTAYGTTYQVTSQIKAHKVVIDGTTCIIVDRSTGPSVSCDW